MPDGKPGSSTTTTKKAVIPLYGSQAQAAAIAAQKAGERNPVVPPKTTIGPYQSGQTIGPYNPMQSSALADQRKEEQTNPDFVRPVTDRYAESIPVYTMPLNAGGMGAVNKPGGPGTIRVDPQTLPGGYGFAAKYDNLYDPQNRPGGYGYAAALANPPGPSIRKPVVPPVAGAGSGSGAGGGVPPYPSNPYPDSGGGGGGGWTGYDYGGHGGYDYGNGGGGYADNPRAWLEGLMQWRF